MTHRLRMSRTSRLGFALASLVGALVATPADARFIRAAVAAEPRSLVLALDRLAADGYRLEVTIDGLPFLAALVSCEEQACRDTFRFSYRALDGSSAADLSSALADGYRFRAVARLGDRPLFLFEHDARARLEPIEMRWLELSAAAGGLDEVAAAREAGFRLAAVGGVRRDVVLLLLERRPGERGEPREVRHLSDHPGPLVGALDRAAAEGFALDAMWSRRPNGNPFTVELHALISRPRSGRTARAPFLLVTDRGEVNRQGRLVASLEWNERRALFFQELPGWDDDVEERDLPAGSVSSPTALKGALDEAFRQTPFDPIVSAWAEPKSDGGSRLVTLSVDEQPSGPLDLEPASPTGRGRPEIVPARPLAIPPGAQALGEGGGEPGALWLAWAHALERRDLAAALAMMSEGKRRDFDLSCRVRSIRETPSERTQKKMLGEWAEKLPRDPSVAGGFVLADHARLRLLGRPSARKDAPSMLYEVELVREAGAWKAEGEAEAIGLAR